MFCDNRLLDADVSGSTISSITTKKELTMMMYHHYQVTIQAD